MDTWVPVPNGADLRGGDERPFNQSQATRFLRKMKKQNYLCVDLTTLLKEGNLRVLNSRKGSLFRNEEDKFTFTERGAHVGELRPEKHWETIDRSRDGKVSANDSHIKLELYIRHENYSDGHDLADQLAYQTEQMGETLCDIDLRKLVSNIRSLKQH